MEVAVRADQKSYSYTQKHETGKREHLGGARVCMIPGLVQCRAPGKERVRLGTARGMAAPQARLAVYNICWLGGCFGSDIMAALDKDVADGVNVSSMSIGGGTIDYYRDCSMRAFEAATQGIVV
ncbi:hypothetical protein ACFE04_021143 [Oxalis oulophora]